MTLQDLPELARSGTLTLLTATRDLETSAAVVLTDHFHDDSVEP